MALGCRLFSQSKTINLATMIDIVLLTHHCSPSLLYTPDHSCVKNFYKISEDAFRFDFDMMAFKNLFKFSGLTKMTTKESI